MELSSRSDNIIALNSFCTLENVSIDPVLQDFEKTELKVESQSFDMSGEPIRLQYHDSLEEMSKKIMSQMKTLKHSLNRSRYYLNELNLD